MSERAARGPGSQALRERANLGQPASRAIPAARAPSREARDAARRASADLNASRGLDRGQAAQTAVADPMRRSRSSRPTLAAPALVWAALAASFLWSWLNTGWSGTSAGAERVLACAQASLALAAILAARRLRGHMRIPDALHALLWLPAWPSGLARSGLAPAWLVVAAVASAALLAWAGGLARFRRALTASAKACAARADQRAVLLALVFALLWLGQFALPIQPATVELDPSWTRAYTWFFQRGAQAGVDYLFTYGPLGALQAGAFAPGHFWTVMAVWELAVKGALAAALALCVGRLRGPLEALLCAFLLLVLPYSVDAYVPLAALALTVLALSARRAWPALPLALALLAALSLVKFTYFSVAAACVAALAGTAALRGSWRAGLGVLGGFALALAAVWVLAGQSLLNFPRYLRGALEIAAGYNRAMSQPAGFERVVLACIAIALSTGLAACHACARPREPGRLMAAALLPLLLFLAFKAGFVRHGGSSTFFGFAALAPFLLLPPARERVRRTIHLGAWARSGAVTGLRLACVGVALLGFETVRAQPRRAPLLFGAQAQARIDAKLRDVLELRERERGGVLDLEKRRRQHVLPRTRAVVGESTIDLIPNEVGLLILNELNWRPRPVFQSYSAYTPALLELNARAFSGPSAPEFVLFRPGALDLRLATLDDALALQVLLRRYRPELEEQGWLLFRRELETNGVARAARPVLIERSLALGERLELSGLEARCLLLEVDLKPSIRGRFVSALYQAPIAWIELGLADGGVRLQRLVPEMTRHGAILDPPLAKLDDWIAWYAGAAVPRVAWIRLKAEPGHEARLEGAARIRIVRANDLAPSLEPDAVLRLISSVLPSAPDEVVSRVAPQRVALGRDRVLVVHAPGELRYRLSAGSFALTCLYGVLPPAQEEWEGDGATFRVLLRDGSREHTLFERHLDPERAGEDRGSQGLQLRFEANDGAQLVLVSDPGPSGDDAGDRSYWARVRVFDPAQRLRTP